MEDKRIIIYAGHYGSGKTTLAVNTAVRLKREGHDVALADMDIVNPYFRAKDSEALLHELGIPLISSPFANSNVDLPSMPQDLYAVVDDRARRFVLDVGGDDRGSLALGRYVPALRAENDYAMLLVVNRFRPLTADAAGLLEVKEEIEAASGLPFTGIANDSNLGAETTAEDVLSSYAWAQDMAGALGLPVVLTAAGEPLCQALAGRVPDLFPVHLVYKRY